MSIDLEAIKARLLRHLVWSDTLTRPPSYDLDLLIAAYDRLTPLAEAAAAWAAAVAEPNGVWQAEQALLAAVKEWQEQSP